MSRVLIAGVGNVFLGDDGFGAAVVAALCAPFSPPLPPGVVACDYGIRGLHLAYELLDPPELLILVDAVARGEAPGTLFLIEPDTCEVAAGADPHGMNVPAVLASVRMLGGHLPRVLIVGCQPLVLDEVMGLSPVVARTVQPAAQWIRSLVEGKAGILPAASDTFRETNHEMGQTRP
jgi:hydrogenase maturation protease